MATKKLTNQRKKSAHPWLSGADENAGRNVLKRRRLKVARS